MSQQSYPICWLCKKEVDKFEWQQRPDTLENYYVAWCHGAHEAVYVDYISPFARVIVGYAFKNTPKNLRGGKL